MKKSERFKVIIAADIVLICLTVIVSSYTIAILLMVALIISVLVLPTNKRNYIIVISAAILCVLVFKESILDLLTAFGRAINSDILVKRLTEIKTMSYIEDYGEESRIAIYHNAWLNYLDRPFLGALQGTKIIYRRSGHSSLLDYLEKYGILSVIYLIYYVEVYKMTAKRIEKMAYKNGYIIYYALFMLLLAFNYSDSSYALACIVYFVAPGILLNLDCRTQKENC
jgi:O-antigen ligase